MAKATLQTVLAQKNAPQQEPQQAPPAKTKRDDGKMTTSLRIEPEKLGRLKMLALRQRVRVNDIIIQAIDNHLAMHEGETGRAA
jgi:hypothetical protein